MSSTAVREPAVAGSLYPDDALVLRSEIDELLTSAFVEMPAPKALIVPHGAYTSSGETAASGYALMGAERDRIQRVIVLGASHRLAVEGISVPRSVAFRTPLGDVLIDKELVSRIEGQPGVMFNDRPHYREHSIEVQLPFIQRIVGSAKLVPLIVGDATTAQVANVLELLWGGPETAIIVSSDLSSGPDFESTSRVDRATCNDIARMRLDRLGPEQCSCPSAIAGLLRVARRRGMAVSELSTSTSADNGTRGENVIGYASFGLWEVPMMPLEEESSDHLLQLATSAATTSALGGRIDGCDIEKLPTALAERRPAFVSVYSKGELRGCVGSLEADVALGSAAVRHATKASADPRLGPIEPSEVADLEIGVAVIGPLERLVVADRSDLVQMLRPGVDGLMVRCGPNRGTFLPSVWASLPHPDDFVDHLWNKAGIAPVTPFSEILIHRYQTAEYGAPPPQ